MSFQIIVQFFRPVGCGEKKKDSCAESFFFIFFSAASHGPYYQETFPPLHDGFGQRGFGRVVRKVFPAGKKTDEGPALASGMVTDCALQDRVAHLEAVEHCAKGGRTLQFQLDLAAYPGQGAQVMGNHDPDHGSVWTSTDSTAGRSRTIAFQVSPESLEAYTWPPVVPK